MEAAEAFKILKKKLDELSFTPSLSVSPTYACSFLDACPSSSPDSVICNVPNQLRQVNETAFEPQIISIGPYHRGKVKTMEICKTSYLNKLLAKELSANPGANNIDGILRSFIIDFQEKLGKSARQCYEGPVDMQPAEFVAMMVLDGLFVVELLRKFWECGLKDQENDDLFKQNLNLIIIAQDLLLLENQLPLFVLDHFFEKMKRSPEPNLDVMAIHFFSKMVPGLEIPRSQRPEKGGREAIQDIKHLLGLIHDRCLPSPQRSDIRREDAVIRDLTFIRSATELSEAGIGFKKHDDGNSLFDIKFEKRQLHIPTLTVDHDSERIFRNLIAYEQINRGPSIVMDYARLMDCLINYADDVAFSPTVEL
ncbi:hypothetical protein PTKIN_Ptkin06aG0182900 [Pterospermum kingtungense]